MLRPVLFLGERLTRNVVRTTTVYSTGHFGGPGIETGLSRAVLLFHEAAEVPWYHSAGDRLGRRV